MPKFKLGDEVIIKGLALEAAKKYNGLVGVVISRKPIGSAGTNMYKLIIQGHEPKHIFEHHLVLANSERRCRSIWN